MGQSVANPAIHKYIYPTRGPVLFLYGIIVLFFKAVTGGHQGHRL